MVPGRSQKRTSTYSICSSRASLKMSSGVLSDTELFTHVGTHFASGALPRLRQVFPGGIGGDAAVDHELSARRIGGFVTGQEEDEIRDLDRLRGTAEGRPDDVVGEVCRHGGSHQPWM